MAAPWPESSELAQVLDVDNVDDWGDTLDRVMAAAIAKVQRDVSGTVEAFADDYPDGPDEALAQASLRMGELMSLRPNALGEPRGLERDPAYASYLHGHRKAFGIA